MWAFSVPAFRQGSKNEFQTTLENLSAEEKAGVLALLGCEGEEIPHSSTVDHALSKIDYERMNEILIKQVDRLLKKKFFYNHQDLLPGNTFCIGTDRYWVHNIPTVQTKKGTIVALIVCQERSTKELQKKNSLH